MSIRADDRNDECGCYISSQNIMGNCRNFQKFLQYCYAIPLFGGHTGELSTLQFECFYVSHILFSKHRRGISY